MSVALENSRDLINGRFEVQLRNRGRPLRRVGSMSVLLGNLQDLIDGCFDVQLERLREIVAGHYAGSAR